MKRRLIIEIEVDDTRCSRGAHALCPYVVNGWRCGLFGMRELSEDSQGWLKRLPECIVAEERP